MIKILFHTLVLACIVISQSTEGDISSAKDELIFVHVIFRHGDRAMLKPYPNDPYNNEKYFPKGVGHLTKAGKLRQYNLGKYIRKRYLNLLGDGKYSPNKVYVESSNMDRTIESAAANLAGLFPPHSDQIWNDEIPYWLPIPIHTIPLESDHIIATARHCPRYAKARKEQLNSHEHLKKTDKMKPYFKLIEQYTGFKNVSGVELWATWDALYAEKWANLTLPDWAEEIIAPNSAVVNYMHEHFNDVVKTKEMQRLKGGFLIREMLERFQNKTESKLNPNRSLWIYSAHDLTIAYLLKSLDIFEPHVPPFASCLFFELRKSAEEEFYIQIFYKNTTEESLLPMNLPNCGIKCPLKRFYEVYKDVIPTEDFDIECSLPTASEELNYTSWNDLTFLICCTIIILCATIYGCNYLWKQPYTNSF